MKKIKHIIPPCRKCVFNPKKYVKTPYNPDPRPQCKRDGYSSYLYIPELTCSKLELSKKTIDIMFKNHPLEDLFSEYGSIFGSMGFVAIGGVEYDIATTVEWDTRLCSPPVTDEELKKIAQLTNLTLLDLGDNLISDITPLAKLMNLERLYLRGNQISDITPLAQLTNLKSLTLRGNQISDITPLTKLMNLTELYLRGNQISDITPLTKLTNLTSLNLRGNQISDITPLTKLMDLEWLDLSDNQISDITLLTKLTNLKIALPMNYRAEMPNYSFEQVVLPDATKKEIEKAIGILEVEKKVFEECGDRSIIPYASSALNFYGPSGPGKAMTAEAIAQKLGKKILKVNYVDVDVESKYLSEGPKMIKALFLVAERENAVLFIDEADFLLLKLQTDMSDSDPIKISNEYIPEWAGQTDMSDSDPIKSQLLASLEKFKGIAIFATDFIVSYDSTFLSRLKNIEFTMPDKNAREKIWRNHLMIMTDKNRIPLAKNINIRKIAKKYKFCERDIKNAVERAFVSTMFFPGSDIVTQKDLIVACEFVKTEKEKFAALSVLNDFDYDEFVDNLKDLSHIFLS